MSRRKRQRIDRMVEGDVEAAHFVSVETVQTTTKQGKQKLKKVKTHIYEPEATTSEQPDTEVFDIGNTFDTADVVTDAAEEAVRAKPTKVRPSQILTKPQYLLTVTSDKEITF